MSETSRPHDPSDAALRRYSRQVLFQPIGAEGQRKLLSSRVTLIGCGALGGVLADTLVRAGVGHLRICDRDYLELDNLQRQTLFDEQDVIEHLPKAEAARRKLARINSQVHVEACVTDVNPGNIEGLTRGADLILDGTDNFETRFLINDTAVKHGVSWVYGAAVAASGLCMTILPGETPCLRCVFDEPPPPELSPTCDTVGVLGPLIHVVAGIEAMEAIKILSGNQGAVTRRLLSVDGWSGRVVGVQTSGLRGREDCPCCGLRRFDYLEGGLFGSANHLCGRNAVQINRKGDRRLDLASLAARLAPVARGPVRANEFLVQVRVEEYELTVFPDGRGIVQGTDDITLARTIYAKYIGA